jgi:penicillin-binding protein 2
MSKRRLNSRLRIQFLGLFMLLGVGSLAVRLWWIQVAHGQEWTSQIRGSSQATVRIPSVRGEIKDRNGLTLVQNRASYEVDFYLPEMVKGYRERFGSPPTSEYRAIISGMPKDMKEPDIIKIVNNGVVPRLNELDLARDYNAGKLQKHFRNDTEVPFSYIKDIDFPTMAKFAEHDVAFDPAQNRRVDSQRLLFVVVLPRHQLVDLAGHLVSLRVFEVEAFDGFGVDAEQIRDGTGESAQIPV